MRENTYIHTVHNLKSIRIFRILRNVQLIVDDALYFYNEGLRRFVDRYDYLKYIIGCAMNENYEIDSKMVIDCKKYFALP